MCLISVLCAVPCICLMCVYVLYAFFFLCAYLCMWIGNWLNIYYGYTIKILESWIYSDTFIFVFRSSHWRFRACQTPTINVLFRKASYPRQQLPIGSGAKMAISARCSAILLVLIWFQQFLPVQVRLSFDFNRCSRIHDWISNLYENVWDHILFACLKGHTTVLNTPDVVGDAQGHIAIWLSFSHFSVDVSVQPYRNGDYQSSFVNFFVM